MAATAFPQESQLATDFRHDHDHLVESCGKALKGFMGCAQTVFTDHPLHIGTVIGHYSAS